MLFIGNFDIFPVILSNDIVNELTLILKFICLRLKKEYDLTNGTHLCTNDNVCLDLQNYRYSIYTRFIAWNKERLLVFSTNEKDQHYMTVWR